MKDFRIHCCKSHFRASVSFSIEMLNIASCCIDCEDFCMVREIMKSVINLSTLTAFLSVSVSGQNANRFRLSTISILFLWFVGNTRDIFWKFYIRNDFCTEEKMS